MPTIKVRAVHCPSCRRPRNVRTVGTATVNGTPVELVRCPDPACELVWAIRTQHLANVA